MVSVAEKDSRKVFVRKLAEEVREEVLAKILRKHGQEIYDALSPEIEIDLKSIDDAVDYYYDFLVKKYKERHQFEEKKLLIGRDKVAAFTAIAILTFKPIRNARVVNDELAIELINEYLASRFAQIALRVDPDGMTDHKQAALLLRNLLQNLFELGEAAAARGRAGDPVQPTELIVSWVIQAMQLFGKGFGKIDLGASEFTS